MAVCLSGCAEVLEAGEASLAQSLRADVAETRAKRERLRQDLLERTREEAVAAAHKARCASLLLPSLFRVCTVHTT